jgi:hypothetical protein
MTRNDEKNDWSSLSDAYSNKLQSPRHAVRSTFSVNKMSRNDFFEKNGHNSAPATTAMNGSSHAVYANKCNFVRLTSCETSPLESLKKYCYASRDNKSTSLPDPSTFYCLVLKLLTNKRKMDNLFVYMCSCFAATQQNGGAESFRSAEFELSTSLIAVIRRWERAVRTEKNNCFHFLASVRLPKRPHPSRRELPQATAGRDRTEKSKTRPEENDFSLAVGLFFSCRT